MKEWSPLHFVVYSSMADLCNFSYKQEEGQPIYSLSTPVSSDFDRHLRQDFCFNGRNVPLEDHFQYGQQPEIGYEVANYQRFPRLVNRGHQECKYCHGPFHRLRDKHGRITCPVLRSIVCYHCNATGEYAHTVRFCPKRKDKMFK